MPIGFKIVQDFERASKEDVDLVGKHMASDLCDAMNKSGAVSRAIQPVYRPMPKFYGSAVTADLPTASFSMARLAMLQCKPGDVLVLNAHGDVKHALLGGHIAHALKVRGVAGVIVDGAVRDATELQDEELPVCARGTAVIVGAPDGPGQINVPVAFGGVVVNPGDIIVADEDGIAVVPREHAAEASAAADALVAKHTGNASIYDSGNIPGMDEVEASTRAAGCEFIDKA